MSFLSKLRGGRPHIPARAAARRSTTEGRGQVHRSARDNRGMEAQEVMELTTSSPWTQVAGWRNTWS